MAEIDFNKDVETLSEPDVATELNTIRGEKDSPYWNPQHLDHSRYLDRAEKLYNKKFPEPGGRQDILNSGERGLFDIVNKEFGSSEKVENEADAARQKMEDQKNEQIFQTADTKIRQTWGPETQENYNILDFTLDKVFNAQDSAKIREAFPNDTELANAIVFIARKLGPIFGLDNAKKYQREEKK